MGANDTFKVTGPKGKFILYANLDGGDINFKIWVARTSKVKSKTLSVSIHKKYLLSVYQAFCVKPLFPVKFIGTDQVSFLSIKFQRPQDSKIGGEYRLQFQRAALFGGIKSTIVVNLNELSLLELLDLLKEASDMKIFWEDAHTLTDDELVDRLQDIKSRLSREKDYDGLVEEIYENLTTYHKDYKRLRLKIEELRADEYDKPELPAGTGDGNTG